MLAAQLTSAGAVPAQLGVVPDDEEEHRKTMERALLGFDMLVTSGGASVGPHDLVRKVQSDLRVDEVFWGVAVKPGKPVAFGVRREHLVFNLPGNPVSALVCFELFVRPAIEALQGIPEPLPAFSTGVLAGSVARNAARARTNSSRERSAPRTRRARRSKGRQGLGKTQQRLDRRPHEELEADEGRHGFPGRLKTRWSRRTPKATGCRASRHAPEDLFDPEAGLHPPHEIVGPDRGASRRDEHVEAEQRTLHRLPMFLLVVGDDPELRRHRTGGGQLRREHEAVRL